MDLTYERNREIKDSTIDLVNDGMGRIIEGPQRKLFMPARHEIYPEVDLSRNAKAALLAASEMQPSSYQELLGMKGIGARTLRSLAIISSVVHDTPIYKRDPVMYSYNLGGKDGIPYRINLEQYDDVVGAMSDIVRGANISATDSSKILRRLSADLVSAYNGAKEPILAKA